jgi:hypothetical protein
MHQARCLSTLYIKNLAQQFSGLGERKVIMFTSTKFWQVLENLGDWLVPSQGGIASKGFDGAPYGNYHCLFKESS